jgi:signal transduction histidine kinase
VLFGDIRKRMHQVLIFLSLATGLWGFGCMMVGLSSTEQSAIFWWKVAHLGGFFTVVFILHLVLLVGNVRNRWFLAFSYIQATFAEAFIITGHFDVKFSTSLSAYYRIIPKGMSYPLFLILWLVVGIYANYVIYEKTRHSEGSERTKYRYLFAALMCGFCGGATHLVTVYYTDFVPLLTLSIPFFPIVTTYAILRHNLLDIEVIIKKTLVFAGLLASVFAMLILPTLIIQEYLVRNAGMGARIAGLTISGIIIILTMRHIENFLINVTDKYLFQKKYDYKELLKTFTSEVLTVLNLDKLINLTVDKLTDTIKISSCAVLLLDNEKQQFSVSASRNLKDQSVSLVKPDEIVTFLEHAQGYFLKKEFAEKKIFIPPQVQEIIDRLNAELLIPMILQEKMIGILSLGKKKSDEEYTQDDLDILLPLARTLAIAISNAELFDDLGKAQAEAAQKEKMALIGTLAAGMAHEIRNPITTIKIFAEYLKEKKDDPEFIAKFEKLVPKEVEKINSMITHLLEFSKPADYRSMQAVDLKEPLEEVLEILQAEMALNDILLKDSIRHVSSISGNKKYVQEIMFNLIQNAVHAIGRRGTITITAEDYPGNVELKVSDTGCGISAENLQHIFEPFFTTKMDSEGVGLGLYVIKQLMLRMGGNISVESKMGEGTTFSLKFSKAV